MIKTKLSVVVYTYLGVTYGLQESGENAHDIFRAVSYRHFIKCHNVWGKRSGKFSAFADAHLKQYSCLTGAFGCNSKLTLRW